MSDIPTIVEDERAGRIISSISNDAAQFSLVVGGGEGITAINAYYESGEMAGVPWLAVWKGSAIWRRYPAHSMSIQYKPTPPQGQPTTKEGGKE